MILVYLQMSGELSNTRQYFCPDTFTVQVPGGTQFTYGWSMIDGVDGTYENGTSSTSENPEFIFFT